MSEITRAKILEAVLSERERQDERWGDQTHNTDLEWISILTEEVGEVAKDVNDHRMAGMFEEIIQCAAVCFAWSEAYINRGGLKDDSEQSV
jgi:NTP pyrophosphatase (non-canonical NTP hydrolase)